MGNAAMRKTHRVEDPEQDDMLPNFESGQSESMDSLVRVYIFGYIFCSDGDCAWNLLSNLNLNYSQLAP